MRKIMATLLPVCIGLVLGAGAMWYLTRGQLPWLEFSMLNASYTLGSTEIDIAGAYIVRRPCNHDGKVVWRTEALATNGQIAVYGPKPDAPTLTVGEHQYHTTLPLLDMIDPDGWEVRLLVSCAGAYPETMASPRAVVSILQ